MENILAAQQLFVLNARLWLLLMMWFSSQEQWHAGKCLFSDNGLKLHLNTTKIMFVKLIVNSIKVTVIFVSLQQMNIKCCLIPMKIMSV